MTLFYFLKQILCLKQDSVEQIPFLNLDHLVIAGITECVFYSDALLESYLDIPTNYPMHCQI